MPGRQVAALELAEAAVDTCGAKAAACGELARVAAASGGAFDVPWGVCLPFGAMEAALQARSPLPRLKVHAGVNLQTLNLYRGLLAGKARSRGARHSGCPSYQGLAAEPGTASEEAPAVALAWLQHPKDCNVLQRGAPCEAARWACA